MEVFLNYVAIIQQNHLLSDVEQTVIKPAPTWDVNWVGVLGAAVTP